VQRWENITGAIFHDGSDRFGFDELLSVPVMELSIGAEQELGSVPLSRDDVNVRAASSNRFDQAPFD